MRTCAAVTMLFLIVLAGCGKPVDRPAEEQSIRQVVLDRVMDSVKADVYFVSIGETPSDPDDEFMRYFQGHVPPVKKASACSPRSGAAPIDNQTGQSGALISAGKVTWSGKYEADVQYSIQAQPSMSSAGTCHVAKKDGKWVAGPANMYETP